MRKVKSRFKLFEQRVRVIEQNAKKALEHTAGFVHTEVEQSQVTPRAEGTLERSLWVDYDDIDKGRVQISFTSRYARRLYYHPEYNFSKAVNPNAKGKWLEDWAEGGSKAQQVKEAYKMFFEMENR